MARATRLRTSPGLRLRLASRNKDRRTFAARKSNPAKSGVRSQIPHSTEGAEPLQPFISPSAAPVFWSIAAICATACVCLGIVQFVGDQSTYLELFPARLRNPDWMLGYRAWWVGWTMIGFLVLPAAFMLLRREGHIRDCNLSWRGFREHVWIYIGLFAVVFPVIYLASWSPSFYSYYPLYTQAGRSWTDLMLWESLYAGQFLALEFFFRGFLVGGLGRYIGILSVPVSVMPYMMLHFSKPWSEAYAAIVAGFVLGWLSWKTKSIWGGVFIHCAVAVSMDLLALSHKGQLP